MCFVFIFLRGDNYHSGISGRQMAVFCSSWRSGVPQIGGHFPGTLGEIILLSSILFGFVWILSFFFRFLSIRCCFLVCGVCWYFHFTHSVSVFYLYFFGALYYLIFSLSMLYFVSFCSFFLKSRITLWFVGI